MAQAAGRLAGKLPVGGGQQEAAAVLGGDAGGDEALGLERREGLGEPGGPAERPQIMGQQFESSGSGRDPMAGRGRAPPGALEGSC